MTVKGLKIVPRACIIVLRNIACIEKLKGPIKIPVFSLI